MSTRENRHERLRQGEFHQKDYRPDEWISDALLQMRVQHETNFVVENLHKVPIALPKKRVVIDVATFTDMQVPSLKLTGTAMVRRRQMKDAVCFYQINRGGS